MSTEIRTHLNEVQRQLLLSLRAAFPVFENRIAITTSTDYSENGATTAKQEKLPIMHLVGPETERNDLFTTHQKPTKQLPPATPGGPAQFKTYTAEEAVDLFYQVIILSDKTEQITDLQTKVHGYFLNGKTVTAEKCPGEPGEGSNTYEIDLVGKFAAGRIVNRSNLKETTGRLIVRGVQVSDDAVFKDGFVAEEVNVTTEPI